MVLSARDNLMKKRMFGILIGLAISTSLLACENINNTGDTSNIDMSSGSTLVDQQPGTEALNEGNVEGTASIRNENLVWDDEIREQDFDGLTVCLVGYDDNIQMLLNNNSGETRTYGGQYVVQYKENGEYHDVPTSAAVPYDESTYEIEHEQIFVLEFDVTCFNCSKPGEYRFVYGDLYCDFVLVEKAK